MFYATTEGQTRRIAEHLAETLRRQGRDSCAIDLGSPCAQMIDWSRVRGAIVGASVHAQWHQKEAHAFVKEHVALLRRVPSAFFSVSLSEASPDPDEQEAARRLAAAFPALNEWTPDLVVSIAGRLAYTKYGFLKRLLMKRIARKEDGPTDTSRDYEFTNWEKVNTLARTFGALVGEQPAKPVLVLGRKAAPAA